MMGGMAIGFYVALTGSLPSSAQVLVLIALTFIALLTAFHGGRSRARAVPPSAPAGRSWDALRRELDRSRRFERRFVLMRIPASDALDPNGRTAVRKGVLGVLPVVLRSIDQAWTIDGNVMAVLPESNSDSATALIARLRSTLPDPSALDGVQIAEFPEDGVTIGALVANLRTPPAPGESAPVRLVPAQTPDEPRRDERTG
ncbi:MAG: hypothetical protein QOI85_1087 [Chloroflexota bacterium]|jgi:hypothetical protein|nr:hypothetical protein [Chloroflexota bacterium]